MVGNKFLKVCELTFQKKKKKRETGEMFSTPQIILGNMNSPKKLYVAVLQKIGKEAESLEMK